MARLLIEHGADVDASNNNGARDVRGLGGETRITRRDVGGWNNYDYTPLNSAASKNSLDVARLLIEHGANTNGIDLSWM